MAIENFGKTWWGEQWLTSLTNIDYSNRLPKEKTNNLINSKKDLAKLTVGSGEKWIGELTDREIGELFEII